MKSFVTLTFSMTVFAAAFSTPGNISFAQEIDDPTCVFHPAYREWLRRNDEYCGPSAGRGMFSPPETQYEGDRPEDPVEPEVVEVKATCTALK